MTPGPKNKELHRCAKKYRAGAVGRRISEATPAGRDRGSKGRTGGAGLAKRRNPGRAGDLGRIRDPSRLRAVALPADAPLHRQPADVLAATDHRACHTGRAAGLDGAGICRDPAGARGRRARRPHGRRSRRTSGGKGGCVISPRRPGERRGPYTRAPALREMRPVAVATRAITAIGGYGSRPSPGRRWLFCLRCSDLLSIAKSITPSRKRMTSQPARTQPDTPTYDYIIVGAGSAGCVLANRLTESGRHSVLLLEAGPRDRNIWIHVPLGYGKLFKATSVNWMYQTEPEPHLNGRSVFQPRGKVLGGSSSINGLLYVRGQHEDYDRWRQLGNAGWGYDDVLPFFKKAEEQQRGPGARPGSGGPLPVSDTRHPDPLSQAFVDAAVQAGLPRNPDFNGAAQEGAGWFQTTTRYGRRASTARSYLRPARRRQNLRVETAALARRIVFEGRKAVGIEYSQGGVTKFARAARELLISGCAYNSPQLLQLSGIGPADLLKSHGIDVVFDAPGVGRERQDHLQ